ncbi:MAG: AAA family ATPase [Alphaproteobacteria bacterium]|nr:AAA family ATPase [Alphaproteobacteria bacterium]MBP7757914.1 AAA family ATPase [Alphaproteobacteria bacterium]MBP7761241.1 AAA family ATPase [Alphaproteobacteria bacterium]MBP7904812.1 AAA family ATPase [Alphaproteobacteria bacterium]
MRERQILAVAGLSGSGKSTLIKKAKSQFKFQHLSASELIKKFKVKNENIIASSEELRTGNLPQNQIDLVHAFLYEKSRIEGDIIFDCHTLIDTPNGLICISSDVFKVIGVSHFAFLRVDPKALSVRRHMDKGRKRPKRNPDELAEQQKIALEAALDIARDIETPFTELAVSPCEEIEGLLSQLNFARIVNT